jgi:hypothetical protein
MTNVYKEMEMYAAFHVLTYKYGKPFLDWYHNNCETIGGDIPIINKPQNEMEKDVANANEKINNPREFNYDEVSQFEEMVCKFLSQNISCSRVIHNEKDKMIMFRNRYSWFRNYYIIKGDISPM